MKKIIPFIVCVLHICFYHDKIYFRKDLIMSDDINKTYFKISFFPRSLKWYIVLIQLFLKYDISRFFQWSRIKSCTPYHYIVTLVRKKLEWKNTIIIIDWWKSFRSKKDEDQINTTHSNPSNTKSKTFQDFFCWNRINIYFIWRLIHTVRRWIWQRLNICVFWNG